MAKLTISHPTTGQEFETDVDFAVVTPSQLIQNMKDNLPNPEQDKSWQLAKGSQLVDQHTTLEKLGFKDGDVAHIVGKVEGA
jgi:Holliday junction resolvasome RuvABC DNA-binding subunit